MRKNIIFGISIILLLLPMVMPTTIITSPRASIEPSQPAENVLDEVLAGTRLAYNFTSFDYGDGIFDMLDMLLSQGDIPVFDKGILGTLEGSDLYFYIAVMRDLYLYQYDYMGDVYENETLQTAYQALPMLELGEDFGVYADLSTFTFPDDIVRQDLDYYFASWPRSDFTFDITGTELWDNANYSFTDAFTRGWNDAQYGDPWHWMDWIDADYYNNDLYWFAMDFGDWQGYWTGADAYWTSGGNVAWNNPFTAYDGYVEGFLTGRWGGYNGAGSDWSSDKIPDKRYVNEYDSYANLYDLGQFKGYEMSYGMYYESIYDYHGAQIYLNERLYHDLYDAQWSTWISGYVNGYDWQYWEGRAAGEYDNFYSNAFSTSYEEPETYDGRDERDEGHNVGMLEGYEDGYFDGFYEVNTNENRLHGMREYEYESYFDGFANGADDELTTIGYDATPDSMPYSTTTSDPYEQGANFAYEMSYVGGYDNGYKFAFLISNSNDLFWKTSLGPFYHMTLPYVELMLLAGSMIPITLPMTMITDLGFASTEYDFWYDNPYGGDYDPFMDDFMVPFTLYAPDTNWVELNDVDHLYNESEPDVPEIITTYDDVAGTFIYYVYMNMSGDGEIEYTLGYNTTSSLLESFDFFVNFTSMPDVWLDVSLNIDESKTETYSPALPTPSTWAYSLEEFTFYFETPPGMDTEGLAEWKDLMLNSIGDPLISVTALGYDGLWAEQELTLYDPEGLAPPETFDYMYPMMVPMGFQILPDWDTFDGMFLTITSVFDNVDILTTVMSALDTQNANVDISNLVIQPETGSYLYNGEVQYYYITFSGDVDGQIGMLNGDFEWETDTLTGAADATLWVAFEYSTGVLVGAGVRAGLDATLSQVPDYGNSGSLSVYIEMKQGVDFMSIPDIYDLGLVDLPAVPEFGIVSIL
ncbi:MAG: hypothetical protein KAS95_02070, partial [Candidatus Heimdallarchaeota archaeon]|nr:hypothetical protein [Candidatus Heimdallarchaeota archaeon]